MNGISYEEKVEKIFDTNGVRSGNWEDVYFLIEKIGLWLRCEWQCGNIESTEEYFKIIHSAKEIVYRKFNNL